MKIPKIFRKKKLENLYPKHEHRYKDFSIFDDIIMMINSLEGMYGDDLASQIDAIDCIIKSSLFTIQGLLLTHSVMLDEPLTMDRIFPMTYRDANDVKKQAFAIKGVKYINFADVPVLVEPIDTEKFIAKICCYAPFDFGHFGHMRKALHPTTMEIANRKGKEIAQHRDYTESFDHILTDGKKWINRHTGEQLSPYFETNIITTTLAAVYELGRRKHLLQQGIPLSEHEAPYTITKYLSLQNCTENNERPATPNE